MTTQKVTGYALIGIAFLLVIYNTADMVADLQNWHGMTEPHWVGTFLKQAASTILAAIGGKILPTGEAA